MRKEARVSKEASIDFFPFNGDCSIRVTKHSHDPIKWNLFPQFPRSSASWTRIKTRERETASLSLLLSFLSRETCCNKRNKNSDKILPPVLHRVKSNNGFGKWSLKLFRNKIEAKSGKREVTRFRTYSLWGERRCSSRSSCRWDRCWFQTSIRESRPLWNRPRWAGSPSSSGSYDSWFFKKKSSTLCQNSGFTNVQRYHFAHWNHCPWLVWN